MKWKKALLCLVCAACLVLGALLPAALASPGSDEIYFLALNDQLWGSPTAQTVPIQEGYTIYVPYYMLDSNVTGIDLGIYVSAVGNRITVFNRQKLLEYDLTAGTCKDRNGNPYARAIMRSGIIYLPISSLCNYFGADALNYYQQATAYGTVIRIYSPNIDMSNASFVDAATPSLSGIRRAYLRSIAATASPSPTVSPSAAPSPSPSPSPSAGTVDKSDVQVYLSIVFDGQGALEELLTALERQELSALVFFAPEDLSASDAAVRRLLSAGHIIGLTVPGDDLDAAHTAIQEGNRLLELIAHTSTRIVRPVGDTLEAADALEDEDWVVWIANVSAPDASTATAYASSLLLSIERFQHVARVELSDSPRAVSALPRVLSALREDHYALRTPLETRLKR